MYRILEMIDIVPLPFLRRSKGDITMLTSSGLAKVKNMGDVSKSDMVRACGYLSTKKGDTEPLSFTTFYRPGSKPRA